MSDHEHEAPVIVNLADLEEWEQVQSPKHTSVPLQHCIASDLTADSADERDIVFISHADDAITATTDAPSELSTNHDSDTKQSVEAKERVEAKESLYTNESVHTNERSVTAFRGNSVVLAQSIGSVATISGGSVVVTSPQSREGAERLVASAHGSQVFIPTQEAVASHRGNTVVYDPVPLALKKVAV
eukprot:TRINITY_DN4019_c0_g4_i4.p1 TRINITY_DN4019_c0_g4~~TRINITY_DN4019_c0_g4_i4.p1  ORF type:complete len:187 (-),score=37.50 TRINITY_DN4019_c0_g4_i4:140-700(-)